MNFSKTIRRLERKGIISRKPNPVLSFLLAFISLIFGILTFYMDLNNIFSYALFSLAGFTFIFAILHMIVVRILEN